MARGVAEPETAIARHGRCFAIGAGHGIGVGADRGVEVRSAVGARAVHIDLEGERDTPRARKGLATRNLEVAGAQGQLNGRNVGVPWHHRDALVAGVVMGFHPIVPRLGQHRRQRCR